MANPLRTSPWDARLARWLVQPFAHTWLTPNHLTSVRLIVGLAAALAFARGTYGWSNLAALLLIASNFLDHTDGELARLSGKCSRFGHRYDLASDALVTVLMFVAIGMGVDNSRHGELDVSPILLGAVAGCAVSAIFYLRMRIETAHGKVATRQASVVGFETEDILYLMPLATLCSALLPLLLAASICAPLYAAWVSFDYRRVMRARSLSPEVAG